MATATTTTTPPEFHESPFPHPDLSEVISQPFTTQDIVHCAVVSKAWSRAMNEPGVWLTMFDKEKFPRIENGTATAKEDFRFMRSITISKRDATPFGEFVGEAPVMSEKTFRRLKYEKDAFDPTKYNNETHVVIVKPSHFLRPYDPELSEYLLAHADFVPENIIDQKVMMIPYSTRNVMELAKKLWKGDRRLHNRYSERDIQEILKHCNKVSTTVSVYVMRIISPQQTEKLTYTLQKQYLEKKGYEVAPYDPRLYLNMIKLLNEGTTPDNDIDVSSSTSDLVRDSFKWEGEELFRDRTVSIGNYNQLHQSEFPIIHLWPTDAHHEIMRAAAVFPAELAVSKELPAGSKRTHDTAFGQ